jgi:hypothetical protein
MKNTRACSNKKIQAHRFASVPSVRYLTIIHTEPHFGGIDHRLAAPLPTSAGGRR